MAVGSWRAVPGSMGKAACGIGCDCQTLQLGADLCGIYGAVTTAGQGTAATRSQRGTQIMLYLETTRSYLLEWSLDWKGHPRTRSEKPSLSGGVPQGVKQDLLIFTLSCKCLSVT